MANILFGNGEKIPKEFEGITLGDRYHFISSYRSNVFLSDPFMGRLIEEGQISLIDRNFSGGLVTIIDPIAHTSHSIFDKQIHDGTGTHETDVMFLFNNFILPKNGVPAGFVRRVHPEYEKDNPLAGELVGKLINKNYSEFGKEVSFKDYIAQISQLE